MKLFAGILAAACITGTASAQVHFNELYVSHAGLDDQEMIELIGTPGTSLDNLVVLYVEGQNNTNQGKVLNAWDLTGNTIPASGYFVLGDTAVAPNDYDLGADNNLENGTETYYLVDATTYTPAGFTALIGTYVNSGATTTIIPTTADAVLDLVSITEDLTEVAWDGATNLGPDGTYFPAGIFRESDYPGAWCTANFLDYDDAVNAMQPRTPGAANGTCTSGPVAYPTFCFGDGSDGVTCPCTNVPTAGSGEGCTHSVGVGSYLEASGSPTVGADTLTLTIRQGEHGQAAIFVSNNSTGAPPIPFYDGALCVAANATLTRHFYQTDGVTPIPTILDSSGEGTNIYPLSLSDFNGLTVPGATIHYQAWMRSPLGPCAGQANISAGISVTWN